MLLRKLCAKWPPHAFEWGDLSTTFNPSEVRVFESELKDLDGSRFVALYLKTNDDRNAVATFSFLGNTKVCWHSLMTAYVPRSASRSSKLVSWT